MGRKRCVQEGCKKLAIGNGISNLCPEHDVSARLNPEDDMDPFVGLQRMTEAEAEKWGRLDAEIRNALLSKQIKKLEMRLGEYTEAERRRGVEAAEVLRIRQFEESEALEREKYTQQQLGRAAAVQQLDTVVESLKGQYEKSTQDLAEKYKVDRAKMVVDPDTRVIRELEG
jgi:hypothetical protein